MKIARFSFSKGISYGILKNNEIICLPTLAKQLKLSLPGSLEELIVKNSIRKIERLVQDVPKSTLKESTLSLNEIKLIAPISIPPKIICLGLNYKDHAYEQGKTPPDEPVIFIKPQTTIIGPNENIIKPSWVKMLDYEAELAIIMNQETKSVSINDAKSRIFGYTILNDVSARDIQFKDGQWTRGKSFDTFAPTGPYITIADQIRNPTNLKVRTWINGELRQDSNTRNMVFNVFEIVHHISHVMTLKPCDIIATGTPAGVGFAMKPKPRFLKHGDVVEIQIEHLGILRNTVVERKITT